MGRATFLFLFLQPSSLPAEGFSLFDPKSPSRPLGTAQLREQLRVTPAFSRAVDLGPVPQHLVTRLPRSESFSRLLLLPREPREQLGNSRIYRMKDPSSSSLLLLPPPGSGDGSVGAGAGNKRRKIIRDGGSPVCFPRARNSLEFRPECLSLRPFCFPFFKGTFHPRE